MNLGIRAILYSARKWKKTLLVFFLVYGAVYLLTARTYYKIVER